MRAEARTVQVEEKEVDVVKTPLGKDACSSASAASMLCRLTADFDTPTVSASSGRTAG